MATNNLEISENIAAEPRAVAKVKYKIISQLARIAGFFLKVNIHHDDIRKDLELSDDLPICYVINYHSFFDLLVLHYVCSIKGLVKPIFKAETNLRAQEACICIFIVEDSIAPCQSLCRRHECCRSFLLNKKKK